MQPHPTSIKQLLAALLAALALTGCAASIDPAMKRQVDQRIATLGQQERSFGAPGATEAPELQVGTWATYKLVDDEGKPSLLTYKVLRLEEGRYWLETVSESYYDRNVNLMRVSFGARTSPEDIEVDRLYQKVGDGDVQEFPPNMLGMMASMYQPLLARLSVSWADLPQEDVRVPAGSFERSYKRRVESSCGPYSDTSEVWYHDAAPVGGTVRSHSLDNGTTMELVDMGTDPQPEIPLPSA